MHELVVISGKGGTGKTSIVASLAVLADGAVLADCDVEAADLDLILTATVRRHERFFSGHIAVIRGDGCLGCGDCMEHCRFAEASTVSLLRSWKYIAERGIIK